ncbi:DNA cytosine methyltransferase [Paenibacillus amylolyticus]|uniref:DNA cytosine methyltransferase n=1 Tax=Paenibacillus amylolyticus TaxID=1451 RepID=UPI00096E5C5C|nr:DNA cytosine methyltransferase [Paenibacillus amylolyticus]OMF47745.1 hypothetical protein BK136_02300 [Paenibacillus amylolyticus]
MRKLSLFSGIGGIDLAAHWANMETVAFCEREPFPVKVLQKNFPGVPIYDDVCTLTAERLKEDGIIGDGRTIDIISAGYPCQPFSNAGKRRGAEDDRHLWPEVARILQEVRPTWFLGENVAGHITLGLDEVLADLEGLGYTAQAFVIPSSSVYAGHRRDRLFIVAHTTCERCGETRGDQCRGPEEWISGSGAHVADSASIGRQGQREPIKPGDTTASGEREASQSFDVCFGTEWAAQPAVGGNTHEFPNGLDGRGIESLDDLIDLIHECPQPALMGMPQYDWEPPRVATGIKDRTGRLKALGNAANPLQIYPIMAAIKAINDRL